MTNAEKFEKVFGIKIDDYPSDICDIADHKYCIDANNCHECTIFKFWSKEYVETPEGTTNRDEKLTFDDLCEIIGLEDGFEKELARQYFSMEVKKDD